MESDQGGRRREKTNGTQSQDNVRRAWTCHEGRFYRDVFSAEKICDGSDNPLSMKKVQIPDRLESELPRALV
jgi:hypothetical protein